MEPAAEPTDADTYVLTDLLRERAALEPDAPAFLVGAGDEVAESVTFGSWLERSEAAARGLVAQGAGRGDRVALLFRQAEWTAYTVAYTAVLRIGAVAVHLPAGDPELTRERIVAAGCTGVVHGADAARVALPAGVWQADAALLEVPGDPLPRIGLSADDPADVLWTSGTTGPAKAFVNAHGTLMYGRGPSGLARLDIARSIVAPMPMGTASSAMSAAFMPLVAQESVLLCDPADLTAIGTLAERYNASTLMLVPWTLIRMVEAELPRHHDLSAISTVALASAALPASTGRRLREQLPGVAIRTFYAQGEVVPSVVLGTFDPDMPMRLGRPGPESRVRILGPDGRDVPAGEIGEIAMTHPAPRRRYLDPARDAAARHEGFTRTSDLGWIDPEGFVHLFDREVDVIRTAAGPVSSLQVEQALFDHPAVVEVAVVGSGAPGTATPEAFVALRPGAGDAELPAFAADRLAPHQVPTAFHRVDALPRGRTGKVLKYRLRERVTDRRPLAHDVA